MTIKEIIDLLSKYNRDADVSYLNYNDKGKYLDIIISVQGGTEMEYRDDGSIVFRRVDL